LKRQRKTKRTPRRKALELIPLGGVNEIGKNMFALESGDEMLLIDCGMSFPGEEHLGVNYLIPDFSYPLKKRRKIVGLILTHGHEDHIGGIPFLPEEIDAPVYGTPITIAFTEAKMADVGRAGELDLYEFDAGCSFELGENFTIEPYHVNHSMPDGVGFAIRTPGGIYVHSGDFKFDQTPVDNRTTDIAKLSALGQEGVDFLTIDVTNVDKPGYTPSERSVGRAFKQILERYKGRRVFIAFFSSNVHRLQQAIDAAWQFGRVVVPIGRSMVQSVNISLELGYLKTTGDVLIDADSIGNYSDGELLILATGTQGEPLSALRLMSRESHKVRIREGDVVIISASPIPGNEAAVWNTIDDLCKLGATVIYRTGEVHVSGHGSREEIKMLCNLLKPRWIMPFHGEPRHVAGFREMLAEMGYHQDVYVQPEIGRRIGIGGRKITYGEKVQSGMRLVDGLIVEEEGSALLEERRKLSQGGVLAVNVLIDKKTKKFKSVNVASQGFISHLNKDIFAKAEQILHDSLSATTETDLVEYTTYKQKIKEKMEKYIWKNTNRRPSILANIIEV
jgi:ribonuclease J